MKRSFEISNQPPATDRKTVNHDERLDAQDKEEIATPPHGDPVIPKGKGKPRTESDRS